MINDELIKENQLLKDELEKTKHILLETQEHLKKYTNSKGHKDYYEKNKEIIKEKGNIHLIKLKEENPDKLKEYRRRAYLKRKEKLQKEKENIDNI